MRDTFKVYKCNTFKNTLTVTLWADLFGLNSFGQDNSQEVIVRDHAASSSFIYLRLVE